MIVFLFNWLVKITGWWIYSLVFRPKYYYEDKKRQSRRIKGSAIIVFNHASVWDVALAMFAFPSRTLRCVAAELLYRKNCFFTLFLHLIGAIRVDRNAYDLDFLYKCDKILSNNGVVEIYPEARIPDPDESRPLEFKPSAIILALRTGAPIIPVCHNATYFGKGRTRIMIGTPINITEMYDDSRSEKENLTVIAANIRRKIIEFSEELEEKEKQKRR